MAALVAGCARSLWPQRQTYALAEGRASSQNVFHPTCFSFLLTFSSLHTFLPVHNFPQAFPSTKLSSINHDSHLHLSGFSPLRKILTVNHYLHNQDFQQPRWLELAGWALTCGASKTAFFQPKVSYHIKSFARGGEH